MKHFKLFIDESGHPSITHDSKYFVLVGCIIEEGKQKTLKWEADLIKYKFLDKINALFHSEEMGKHVGDFEILAKEPARVKPFEKQLMRFLSNAPITVTASVVSKADAYAQGWKEETIIRKASESLLLDFLAFLYGSDGETRGRVVYESAGFMRDNTYLQAFNNYLDPGWESRHPEYTKVRDRLTSITFANKQNEDIEMQLADMFTYAVMCKFWSDNGMRTFEPGTYETKLIKVLEKKTICMPPGITKTQKKLYYAKLRGISYFPPHTKKRAKTPKADAQDKAKGQQKENNKDKEKRTA